MENVWVIEYYRLKSLRLWELITWIFDSHAIFLNFLKGGHLRGQSDSRTLENGDFGLAYICHCSGLGNSLLKIEIK